MIYEKWNYGWSLEFEVVEPRWSIPRIATSPFQAQQLHGENKQVCN